MDRQSRRELLMEFAQTLEDSLAREIIEMYALRPDIPEIERFLLAQVREEPNNENPEDND